VKWLVFVAACAGPQAPTIDGVVGADEWAGARVERVEDVTLRFRSDAKRLYIAVERAQPTAFACVFVAREGMVRVLHASAKLGSATYVDGKPQSKDYAWKDAATMQREEGWHATTMKSPAVQEFAIDRAQLGPIAIGIFVAPDRVVVWPPGLRDGVANVELVAGFNPDGVTFDTAKWITVVR
jgi:hypothetical protein